MRTRNYLVYSNKGMPKAMVETQEWLFAVDAYDYGDPEPLAELIESGEVVPKEYLPVFANIVRGERKPNKKAAAKLKVPARDRLKMAAAISVVLGLVDAIKHDVIDPNNSDERGVIMLGDRDCTEPSYIRAKLEAEARKVVEEAASDLGVSVETIENMLRDLRKKAAEWPSV